MRRTCHEVLIGALGLGCALASAESSASAAGQLFVTTTNYEITGSTARMALAPPWTTITDEYTVHSDAVVRSDGRYVYVLNRFGADNVLVLDAASGYEVVTQYSVTGTGRNPHDLVVTEPGRAYVSLYESSRLLILNPTTGVRLGTVDLSAFADADGLPEIDQLERLGDRLFVSVQRRLRTAGWAPAGGAGVVVVDTSTDTVVDADPATPGLDLIELGVENPFWRMEYDSRNQRLMVLASGEFLSLDGALVEINPFTLRVERYVVLESELGGDLLDFAQVSETLGYALVGELDFDTCLLRFDPSTGEKLSTVLCTSGFQLSDLELDAAGRLYVGDRTPSNPGVRVFDAASGQLIAGPVDVGLPPFDLVAIDAVVTATAPIAAATPALRAWPNPFNPRVQLRMGAAPSTDAPPRMEILDTRGRRVRLLPGRHDGDGVVWEWDGRAADGASAASGRYWARVAGRPGLSTPVTLVR